MKSVVVANEQTDCVQALYVDGRLVAYDDTIYVSTVVEHVGSDPITILQEDCDLPEFADWPATLEELRGLQVKLSADGKV